MASWIQTATWFIAVLVIITETTANARKSERIKFLERENARLGGEYAPPARRATKDDIR